LCKIRVNQNNREIHFSLEKRSLKKEKKKKIHEVFGFLFQKYIFLPNRAFLIFYRVVLCAFDPSFISFQIQIRKINFPFLSFRSLEN
jgi:hypothetical protein